MAWSQKCGTNALLSTVWLSPFGLCCCAQDASALKAKQFEDDANVKVHRIRITLTSRNVKNLEKGAHRPTVVKSQSTFGAVWSL